MWKGQVVIFLDEIDSIARKKHSSEDDTTRRIKNELLRGLECISEAQHVCCVASTNVPWELDNAVVRRFERRIYVGLPEEGDREKLFQHYLGEENEMDLKEVSKNSEGLIFFYA